ncbi:AraC family transcriptional regulator [Christensenellaceae bacterium OttesenSCG-928-K19]|nr:AraC family transcriptional regulator [Christensenellaceae bacterium OttesenSCG-928-K19]
MGSLHFEEHDIIEQTDTHTLYSIGRTDAHGKADAYHILDGVDVVLLSFYAQQYNPTVHKSDSIVEINHCLSGRAEFTMQDGCLQYIGEDDLFMSTLANHSDSIGFPLCEYEGMVVVIDMQKAQLHIDALMLGMSIDLKALFNKYFNNDACFWIGAKDTVRRIFTDMYTIPLEARILYYKLKIQELLLYLYYFDQEGERQENIFAHHQAELIKLIHSKITGNLDKRHTIDELAAEFHISPTTLKTNFKGVFGMPIAAYMKKYRLDRAAELLNTTTKSIAEIADAVGYESQSKFGAAFKHARGVSPTKYRDKVK